MFASATLDALVNAAERFSTAIGQQLEIVQNAPASAEFVEKTIAYAEAKTIYFWALREAMPELINIGIGKEYRPVQVEEFSGAFSVVGEKQEKVADEKTLMLLERFSGNPGVERARAEFKLAGEIEEIFHKDFDGIDFTSRELKPAKEGLPDGVL